MIIRRIAPQKELRKLRVAAYARVSTGTEEQAGSYETQVDYYTRLIQQNAKWEYVDVYADRAKTATSAEHRPEFQRMIADAKERRFDLLLVKAISRFARNVVDAQNYVHELKQYDVEVRFENEAISSFDPSAEMMFNILAATAQQESKNKSEYVRWTYRKLAEQGIRHIGNNRVLGYDEVKGKLTPNGDAWIIARAFELFTDGVQLGVIAKTLTAEGACSLHRKGEITSKTVYSILRNELYVGDRTLQKQAPHNYLTKRPDPTIAFKSHNITNDHEAIIPRGVWNRAQTMIAQADAEKTMGIHRTCAEPHFLYGHVFCVDCGAPFTRRTLRNRDGSHYKAWNCRERQKGRNGNGCKNIVVKEDELLQRIAEELGVEQFDESLFQSEAIRVLVSVDGIQFQRKQPA